MELFFTKCNQPKMTLEKGLQFSGSMLNSRGELYYVELYTNGKFDKGTCTNGDVIDLRPWSTALMIEKNSVSNIPINSEKPTNVCIDSVPVDFKFEVKRRQRVGSNVTSLRRFTGIYNLFCTDNKDGVFMRLEVTHEMLILNFYTHVPEEKTW